MRRHANDCGLLRNTADLEITSLIIIKRTYQIIIIIDIGRNDYKRRTDIGMLLVIIKTEYLTVYLDHVA